MPSNTLNFHYQALIDGMFVDTCNLSDCASDMSSVLRSAATPIALLALPHVLDNNYARGAVSVDNFWLTIALQTRQCRLPRRNSAFAMEPR